MVPPLQNAMVTPKAGPGSIGPLTPPPQPPTPGMAPPPPPAAQVLDTPDVLPQPTPPTSPEDTHFGMKRYPSQDDAGMPHNPSTSPMSSAEESPEGGNMMVNELNHEDERVLYSPASDSVGLKQTQGSS